jgi:hypothetical protein
MGFLLQLLSQFKEIADYECGVSYYLTISEARKYLKTRRNAQGMANPLPSIATQD